MNNNEEILDSKIDDLYMVFVINNQKYALSSKYITEIIEILPITKVPFLPEYMKGIINLRSTIIPVMDARMRFGMEPIEYSERTCIIIIENEANKIGLIVDAVNEVLTIPPKQIMESTKEKNDLKVMSEKLEVINEQLAMKQKQKRKMLVNTLIVADVCLIILFILLAILGSPYQSWDYSDPEWSVIGTLRHSFEWVYFKVAPLMVFVITAILGIIFVKRNK